MNSVCSVILFGFLVTGLKAAPWSAWSGWERCSVTCGTGVRYSRRTCLTCRPGTCEGSSFRTTQCRCTRECPPVNGGWSSWQNSSACSVTCDGGVRTRNRTCDNPTPAYGGLQCQGESHMSEHCNENPCPVNGGWSGWNHPSACSVTCGGGVRTRTRTCNHPTPAYGGLQCPGVSHMSEHCNENHCPVDGGWSGWNHPSACSVTCGGGVRTRTRTCNHPTPAYGGHQCRGESHMSEHCNGNHCPVNGGWSGWNHPSACSVTCGGGVRTRTRTCNHPTPAYGGLQCRGESHMSEHCNGNPCPVNGVLLAWGDWSPCSVTCGSGSRVRSRACIPPKYGGLNCTGPLFEINNCIQVPCQTPPAGVACPSCTEHIECTWNTTCHVSDICMVRSLSITGFKFTTHCIMKDDCLLLKMLANKTHGEVFCCPDENCVRALIVQ
nr:coadhesin-like isoform X3 [Crassostrea gigas]